MISALIANLNKGSGTVTGGVTLPSSVKASAFIDDLPQYQGFGFIENTSPDISGPVTRLTYFCRVAVQLGIILPAHLPNGWQAYRHYDVATDVWGPWVFYGGAPNPDARDSAGGRMDNNEIIVFNQKTWTGINNYYVKVSSGANLTLSGLQTIKGVPLLENDVLLAKDQDNAAENGIWRAHAPSVANPSGAWTRFEGFTAWENTIEATVGVDGGTATVTEKYIIVAPPTGTVGTTAMTFTTVAELHDARTIDIFSYKFGLDFGTPAGPVSLFDADPTLERLFRGEVMGRISKGDAPGEYYALALQWNDDEHVTGPKRYLVSCLHTTDYFNTISNTTIVDEDTPWAEGALEYLGAGKMVVFLRNDGGGLVDVSYSSNYGATWTYPVPSNMGWMGQQVKIPARYRYNGLLNIIYQDRDTGLICISRNNDPAVFFNNPLAFNNSDIWTQNSSTTTTGNAALGYADMIHIGDGVFVIVWTFEHTRNKANLKYTRSRIDTSIGLPVAPPVLQTGVFNSSSIIRVDMMSLSGVPVTGGYTLAQLENIRNFITEVSLSPDFSTHEVFHFGWVIRATGVVNQMYWPSTFLTIRNLNPGTTIYYRVKAQNFNGESVWANGQATTLT